MPEREFSWPVYDIFTTRDERQIFVGAVTAGQWSTLCRAIGLERLLDDPGLQTKMDQIEARDRTLPLFAGAIAAHDFDALETAFETGGIPFSPINRPAEMYDDPHVMRPGGLHHSALPDGDTFRAPGLPIEVDGAIPAPSSLDIAAIGADTEAVLSGLGLSPEDVAAARGAPKGNAA